MKLINVIHENFKATNMPLSRSSDGGFNFQPQVFSLKSDKLDKIRELPFCDEFKNVELKIIHTPSFEGHQLEIKKFDKNTVLNFGPLFYNGIVYLYQINTIDFKTFDLRYHYQPTLKSTHYRGHDLSDLTEEQKEHIIGIINGSRLGFTTEPAYIENRILDFKRENATKKVFETTVVLDDKKPFAPGTIKEDMADIANKELTAENFDEVMAARTKTSFPVEPTTFTVIKNMEKNMQTKKYSYHEFLNTPNSTLLTTSDFEQQYELIKDWMQSDRKLSYLDWVRRNFLLKQEPKEDGLSYTSIAKEMAVLEKTIDDCDGLDEEQILSLKEKIKNFENKLKDKVKPKTITISSVVHNKIKNYCSTFGLKIGDWVEETLLDALDCTDKKGRKVQTHEEWLEEGKEELMRKWKEYQKINKLIKTDYLILKPKFKFKGFSFLDHKPMYDYLGTDKELQHDLETIKCKIYLTTDKRELDNLIYLNEFADMPVEGFDINLPEEEIDLDSLTSDGIKKLINILSGKK